MKQEVLNQWKQAVLMTVASIALWVGSTAMVAAATSATVRVVAGDTTLYENGVYVTNDCATEDFAGTTLTFASNTAVCSLDQAATYGEFEYELVSYSFGPFLNRINNYDTTDEKFWMFYVNGESSSVGIADYEVQDGDELLFTFGGWPNYPLIVDLSTTMTTIGKTVNGSVWYDDGSDELIQVTDATVMVGDLVVEVVDGSFSFSPSEAGTYKVSANSDMYTKSAVTKLRVYPQYTKKLKTGRKIRSMLNTNASEYLNGEVNGNGMIEGNIGLTEWAAIALARQDIENADLRDAVVAHRPTTKSGTSEIARHILALEALDTNARNSQKVNYVKRLKATRSEGQFGDTAYCNDDLFAGLALLSANEKIKSPVLEDAVKGALRCVKEDGSFSYAVGTTEGDVDSTASFLWLAGALKGKAHFAYIKPYRKKAAQWLRDAQNLDGGWGYTATGASNSSSTAWVVQALTALGHDPKDTTTNRRNGLQYLRATQRDTGAFRYDNDGSASEERLNTAYAMIALQTKAFPALTIKAAKKNKKHKAK